jgi:HSP20 family protein
VKPIRWKPFGLSVTELDRQLDELFDSVIESTWHGTSGVREWRPQMDVYEGTDAYLVTADLPGISPEHLSVTVTANQVQICGERTEAATGAGEHCVWSERWKGRFCRRFPIRSPIDVDGIKITHNEGVYTIRLPKATRGA